MTKLWNQESIERLCRSERAVYVPLLATIIFALFTIIVGLGLDSESTKRAARKLTMLNEEICKRVASRPVLEREALTSFRDQVQNAVDNNLVSNVLIVDAKITLPTMPYNGDFCFQGPNGACVGSVGIPSTPFGSAGGLVSFGSFFGGSDACSLACVGQGCTHPDCKLLLDVRESTTFPQSMWNNTQNAGNTVGCELTGSMKTFLHGMQTVSVKTAWAARLRGEFPDYNPAATDLTTIRQKSPGLVVGIAPYFTTKVGDQRFRFINSTNSQVLWDPQNPLRRGVSAFTQGPRPGNRIYEENASGVPTLYRVAPPRPLSNATGYSLAPVAQQSARQPSAGELPDKPDFANLPNPNAQPAPSPGVDYIVPSDDDEMLTSCANPAAMMRNEFLSTVLELLSRTGETRNMVQFDLIAPQNRELMNVSDPESLPIIPNNPTVMVDFGQDLVPSASKDRYQVPYISYNSGLPATIPAEFQPAKGGYLNPFVTSGAGTPLAAHQALIAGQARYCNHLMRGAFSSGIDRYDAPGNELDTRNQGLEPSTSGKPYEFQQSLRSYPFPAGIDTEWDQECPWGGDCHMNYTRGLTAPELADSFGAVQECPYQEVVSNSPNADIICAKPSAPAWGGSGDLPATRDLRPDLFGFLCFLATKPDGTAAAPCPSSGLKAAQSPGLFPIHFDPAHPEIPFGSDSLYTANENVNAPVLLVTHQRLSKGERDAIHDLIHSGAFDTRPITIAYFPIEELGSDFATWSASSDKAIQDFRFAFNIPDQSTERSNAIFLFSPFAVDGRANNTQQWQLFRDYWYSMLSDPENNVGTSARTIFFERILRVGLAL